MKVSNLFIFYYSGGAEAPAIVTPYFDAGSRRNAYAHPTQTQIVYVKRAPARLPIAVAAATAFPLGHRRYARSGVISVSASARVVAAPIQARRARLGTAGSRADGRSSVSAARAFRQSGRSSASAVGVAHVTSARRQLRLGRVSAYAGPDEVLAEFEEILFLLEVA